MTTSKGDIPDKSGKIAILGLIIMLLVSYHLFHPPKPLEGEIERENTLILIEGHSLKAVPTIPQIKPQVLGIIIDNGLTVEQASLLNDLWFCEASYKHMNVWGDAGRAYGAFQYWKTTWNHFCEGERANFQDQLDCAKYMIFELRIGPEHWVNCWRKMNLWQYKI